MSNNFFICFYITSSNQIRFFFSFPFFKPIHVNEKINLFWFCHLNSGIYFKCHSFTHSFFCQFVSLILCIVLTQLLLLLRFYLCVQSILLHLHHTAIMLQCLSAFWSVHKLCPCKITMKSGLIWCKSFITKAMISLDYVCLSCISFFMEFM